MTKKIDTTVQLFGLSLFSSSKEDLLNMMKTGVCKKYGMLTVATPNPEQVVQAHRNSTFKEHLQQFDLLLADGQGIVWASRVLNSQQSITERIAGREVVAQLVSFASDNGKRILIIGGRGYDLSTLKTELLRAKKQLTVRAVSSLSSKSETNAIYWTAAYVDVRNPLVKEELSLKQTLENVKPDIVFVAFGAPYQEAWIQQHQALLKEVGVELAMVVGGSFDYLTGKVPVVPPLFEKLGLEWLFRLITQPWRFTRQLRLVVFVWLVLVEKLKRVKN